MLTATLTIAPNVLLRLLGREETEEIWIRVLGAVVFLLGWYNRKARLVVPRAWSRIGRGVSHLALRRTDTNAS